MYVIDKVSLLYQMYEMWMDVLNVIQNLEFVLTCVFAKINSIIEQTGYDSEINTKRDISDC